MSADIAPSPQSVVITVLQPFIEQRTGRAYAPGDVITDPAWQTATSRKAEAYAARGLVQIEPAAPAETPAAPVTPALPQVQALDPADGIDAKEASAAGRALRQRRNQAKSG